MNKHTHVGNFKCPSAAHCKTRRGVNRPMRSSLLAGLLTLLCLSALGCDDTQDALEARTEHESAKAQEEAQELQLKAAKAKEKAKQSANEVGQDVKETATEAKDAVKDAAEKTADKVEETVDKVDKAVAEEIQPKD